MPEPMDLGLGVEPPHPRHMHITPHKAHTHALGLGQVLQAGYEGVPLAMMLPCRVVTADCDRSHWMHCKTKYGKIVYLNLSENLYSYS